MHMTSIHKGRTVKTVNFDGTARDTDAELIAEALTAANETKSSLFGWNVTRYLDPEVMDSATVELWTD